MGRVTWNLYYGTVRLAVLSISRKEMAAFFDLRQINLQAVEIYRLNKSLGATSKKGDFKWKVGFRLQWKMKELYMFIIFGKVESIFIGAVFTMMVV